jgi:P27 family predicted phage terminase small subunit
MPRQKKPAGTTVDPRNGRRADLTPVAGGRLEPPPGLSPPAQALWDAYWDDTVSGVQTPVDRGVLTRWITEYDRYLRTSAEADKQPLVTGSTGQKVENPLYKIAYRALEASERCEKQLGIGPLHRSSLGIAVISEQRSLQQMNAAYGGGDADNSAAAPQRPDPRVIDAAS